MTTILDTLKINPPQVYRVPKKILEGGKTDPDLIYGVELEIENLDEDEERRAARKVPGMEYHKDGSLRNNGGEFVTLPMHRNTLEYVLDQFFQKNKLGPDNYSERCSVHVHANCTDLTPEQLRLVLCLYQILERVLFNFIKEDREGNIFCVPWSESIIGTQVLATEKSVLENSKYLWRKYTALNLLPLYTQGTIEFRHMAGTSDLDFILQWCDTIGCIFKYARTHRFADVIDTLMGLNTSSAYATFMMDIFTPSIHDVLAVGHFKELLEDGVLNMKIMLAAPPKNQEPKAGYDWGFNLPEDRIDIPPVMANNPQGFGWFQGEIPIPVAPANIRVNRNPFEAQHAPRVPRPPRNLR